MRLEPWKPPFDAWPPAQVIDLRRALNLSQVKLARKLGATAQTVSNWERGAARPGHRYARALEALRKDAIADPARPER